MQLLFFLNVTKKVEITKEMWVHTNIFDIQSEVSKVGFLFYSGGGTNPHGGQW